MKLKSVSMYWALVCCGTFLTCKAVELPNVSFFDFRNGSSFLNDIPQIGLLIIDDQPVDPLNSPVSGFSVELTHLEDPQYSLIMFAMGGNDNFNQFEAHFLPLTGIKNQVHKFRIWYMDQDGNEDEDIIYFDTFDRENPLMEAEWYTNTEAQIEVVYSTDAQRDWAPQDQAVTGVDAGEFLDYELGLPAGNYHIYLKQNLEGREHSTISLHQMSERGTEELGVFLGEPTPGFYRNFPLMNRSGKRMRVVSTEEVFRFRLQVEDVLTDGESLTLNYLVWVPTDEPAQRWALQSAPKVEGPFVDDPMADVDSASGVIQTDVNGDARFFRLRELQDGDQVPEIESLELNDEGVTIRVKGN